MLAAVKKQDGSGDDHGVIRGAPQGGLTGAQGRGEGGLEGREEVLV